MANFINKYADQAAYEADSTKQYPNVSLLVNTQEIVYERTEPIDYSKKYFTTVALSDGNIDFNGSDISYSTDEGGTWSDIVQRATIQVSQGDRILWKGETPSAQGWNNSTANFEVEGNIMSLLFGDNFVGQTSLGEKNLQMLFLMNEKLVSAENLVLPATILSEFAYGDLFGRCPYLTTAPKQLPATTLNNYCYTNMFAQCFSLTTAPELPATTLGVSCYNGMFSQCTSLTTAPALPATTLVEACYSNMFQGCTNLTTAPELPATTLANECYSYMFQGCTSLTTAPQLPATTLAEGCYGSMFNGCTSLTEAPQLPAMELSEFCYYHMFSGCTSLNSITCLATDIRVECCTEIWVDGVASNGTFYKAAEMENWRGGTSGIPSGWTVQDYQG